ncbi:hypothetical protein BU23DRAFT_70714, partial [Bimuria novae-zelandiae CBS 107.79]
TEPASHRQSFLFLYFLERKKLKSSKKFKGGSYNSIEALYLLLVYYYPKFLVWWREKRKKGDQNRKYAQSDEKYALSGSSRISSLAKRVRLARRLRPKSDVIAFAVLKRVVKRCLFVVVVAKD